MKKTKKGFSLAELLIAMGIVSVVATLGFSVAKRSIENAYDLYIHTGYKGITNAIGNAASRNIYIQADKSKFIADVADTLNAEVKGSQIIAPNGIYYTFSLLPTTDPEGNRYYLIKMEVPAVNKNGTNRRLVCLTYAPDKDWSILIPIDINGICTSSIENLYDRIDLLPFYIDDGFAGRKKPSDGYKYIPRTFVSARQALCKVHSSINIPGLTQLNCSGVTVNGTVSPESRIILTHPRKAN